MQNEYDTFTKPGPITVQPSFTERGYASPLNQDNTDHPQMPLTELNNPVCAICRENYEVGNVIGKLKGCGHIFHENCVLDLLGVPSIYLDPSESPQMHPYCCRKAVRVCGPNTNMYLYYILGATCCMCCIPYYSCNLHPRRVELTDNDIRLLHKPDDPGFLADHIRNLDWYFNYCHSTEWLDLMGRLPRCPCCRKPFEIRGSYTLYQIVEGPPSDPHKDEIRCIVS